MALNEKLNIRLQELALFNMYGFDMMAGFGIRGIQGGNKFGQIDDIDIADGRVPVWEEVVDYPYQTSQFTPSFASTDADDTLLGTGARIIEVQGNDEEGFVQSETIELNGLTPVASTKTWSRVYRMFVTKGGAQGGARGNIYCGLGAFGGGIPATVLARITNGNNQTQMCIFTVPKGFYCAITSITYTVIGRQPIVFHDEARLNNSPFDNESVFRNTRTINVDTDYSLQLRPYGIFPELTDLQITGLAAVNNSRCECSFRYILIPKTLIDPYLGG